MVGALLVVAIAATAAMGRDPVSPPAFRLPTHVTPERYEATLSIDPRSPAFSGEIAIDVRIERASDVVWLNATGIAVQRAELRQGDRASALRVVPGGDDFVGLRGKFLPGRARLSIAYRGKVEDVIVEGVSMVANFRSQFQSILSSGGPDRLLKLLREKNASGQSFKS